MPSRVYWREDLDRAARDKLRRQIEVVVSHAAPEHRDFVRAGFQKVLEHIAKADAEEDAVAASRVHAH
jgi:hypothetical protein